MLFSRSTSLKSDLDVEAVVHKLRGQKFDIRDLQFEVIDNDSLLKIIPHTEYEEKFRILPITHIHLKKNGSGTNVQMRSKPRRIDIGGPNLLIIFCLFMIICGGYLFFFKGDDMRLASYITMGLGVLIFLVLWVNLENGYFNYFRQQKSHIRSLLTG